LGHDVHIGLLLASTTARYRVANADYSFSGDSAKTNNETNTPEHAILFDENNPPPPPESESKRVREGERE
jgi:hypothetical protein